MDLKAPVCSWMMINTGINFEHPGFKQILEMMKKDMYHFFIPLLPNTSTRIVLKQPKTEGSIRTVYIPETVAKKLEKCKAMQMKLKQELGDDGYMDYGLIIGSQNGFTAHSRYKHHFHSGQFKVCGKQINIFLVMQNTEIRVSVFFTHYLG